MVLLVVALMTYLSSTVYAWGPDAQTATAQIAERLLNQEAKGEVGRVLRGQKLGDIATWADSARNGREWAHTGTWHYINLPNKLSSDQPEDIVEALEFCSLQYRAASAADKVEWLKFIVHLVGDMHQPLHTGTENDRGGNETFVTFMGREIRLHALWDSAILRSKGLNANKLTQKLMPLAIQRNQQVGTLDSAKVIAENREVLRFAYSFQEGIISEEYAATALPIIEDRIVSGGIRLASFLNMLVRQ